MRALAREEGFQDALDELLPEVMRQNEAINKALTKLVLKLERGTLHKDDVPLLRTLLAERQSWVNRKFGTPKARAQVESVSVSLSADVADLAKSGVVPMLDGVVLPGLDGGDGV